MNYPITDAGLTCILRPPHLNDEYQNREFLQQAEQIIHVSSGPITVDLTEVPYLNSSGLNFLVRVFQKSREGGRPFALKGVSNHAREVLKITHLDRVFY